MTNLLIQDIVVSGCGKRGKQVMSMESFGFSQRVRPAVRPEGSVSGSSSMFLQGDGRGQSRLSGLASTARICWGLARTSRIPLWSRRLPAARTIPKPEKLRRIREAVMRLWPETVFPLPCAQRVTRTGGNRPPERHIRSPAAVRVAVTVGRTSRA